MLIKPENSEETLTEKQERFCWVYVANGGNATDAAREAGYDTQNEGSPRVIGWENLTKPNIVRRIAEIRRDLGEKGVISKEWVIARLKRATELNLEEIQITTRDGKVLGTGLLNAKEANKGLELLGKTLGIYTDKILTDNTNLNVNTDSGLDPERATRIVAALEAARSRRDSQLGK